MEPTPDYLHIQQRDGEPVGGIVSNAKRLYFCGAPTHWSIGIGRAGKWIAVDDMQGAMAAGYPTADMLIKLEGHRAARAECAGAGCACQATDGTLTHGQG